MTPDLRQRFEEGAHVIVENDGAAAILARDQLASADRGVDGIATRPVCLVRLKTLCF
jgi:hypothetical protein